MDTQRYNLVIKICMEYFDRIGLDNAIELVKQKKMVEIVDLAIDYFGTTHVFTPADIDWIHKQLSIDSTEVNEASTSLVVSNKPSRHGFVIPTVAEPIPAQIIEEIHIRASSMIETKSNILRVMNETFTTKQISQAESTLSAKMVKLEKRIDSSLKNQIATLEAKMIAKTNELEKRIIEMKTQLTRHSVKISTLNSEFDKFKTYVNSSLEDLSPKEEPTATTRRSYSGLEAMLSAIEASN